MEDREEVLARRALDRAQSKIQESDYFGAKKFGYMALNLYPNLEGLNQVLMMINVFISASNKGKCGPNWYGVLGVNPLADDEAVKKQYKKLALLFHPDKNRFKGAEEAFRLVKEACCVLSDEIRRSAYDRKWKPASSDKTAGGMQRPPNPQKPASSRTGVDPRANARTSNKPKPKPKPEPKPEPEGEMCWTIKCTNCSYRKECQATVLIYPNCCHQLLLYMWRK